MLDPLDSENRPLLDALRRGRRVAFFVLLFERISQHFWRPALWVLLFAALWILEVPQFLGLGGQIASLIIFVAGLFLLIRRDAYRFHVPNRDDIDRRLESTSLFRRGQIRALEDRLANPHKRATRELWNKGQKQMLETLPGLNKPKLRPLMIRLDPRGLRFAVVLLFISAILVAGSDWQRRLWMGLLPVTPGFILSQGRADELWITPPEYTGMASLHITGSAVNEPLKIPQDSQIKLRSYSILGGIFAPGLSMGEKTMPVPALGDGLYGLETVIEPAPADAIILSQMLLPRARWNYEYVPDTPPTVRLDNTAVKAQESEKSAAADKAPENLAEAEPPKPKADDPITPDAKQAQAEEKKEPALPYEILANGQIRFPLIVQDDYGVTDLTMTMRSDPVVTEKPRGKDASETRPVMSAAGTELKVQPIFDLTGHTWAGLPVIFEFTVKDHKGQEAKSETVSLTLPERNFEHPVAKLLIALRKKLAWSPGNDFPQIAAELEAVLSAPDLFHDDHAAFLSIRAASARLMYTNRNLPDEVEKTAEAVIELLWETALSIEDGNLSMAMRNLRQAQRELENALRDPNTSPEEIARLMDNLRESMMEYFIELSREMEKRMAEGEETPDFNPEDLAKMIDPDTLSKMMEQMESDLQSGDRDSAREKLSQLQNLLDMMDPSMEAPLPEDMQMAMEGINELQQLIESQEKLRDQTKEQAKFQQYMQPMPQAEDLVPPAPSELMTTSEDLGLSDMPPAPEPVAPPPLGPMQDAPGDQGAPNTQNSEMSEVPSPGDTPGQGSEPRPGNPGNPSLGLDTQPNKAEQEALRYVLGSLMLESSEKLGEVPEGMGKAELEMRDSSENLGLNQPKESIPHQEKAIEYLKEAQEQLQKTLTQRMQQMTGLGFSRGQKYDPLGRPYGGDQEGNGPHHGSQVKIPDEAEKKRVEEILKELRRRSGEMDRPPQEREYYRRLLRQF